MRKILAVILVFFALPVCAELPSNTKNDEAVRGEWERYTEGLLKKMFADDPHARQVKIVVLDSESFLAKNFYALSDDKTQQRSYIFFGFGILRAMETESEYLFVFSHEFAHFALEQKSTKMLVPVLIDPDQALQEYGEGAPRHRWGVEMREVENYELRKQYEIAADNFALEVLRRNNLDICSGFSIMDRPNQLDPNKLDPNDEGDAILIKRMKLLQATCEESK